MVGGWEAAVAGMAAAEVAEVVAKNSATSLGRS